MKSQFAHCRLDCDTVIVELEVEKKEEKRSLKPPGAKSNSFTVRFLPEPEGLHAELLSMAAVENAQRDKSRQTVLYNFGLRACGNVQTSGGNITEYKTIDQETHAKVAKAQDIVWEALRSEMPGVDKRYQWLNPCEFGDIQHIMVCPDAYHATLQPLCRCCVTPWQDRSHFQV